MNKNWMKIRPWGRGILFGIGALIFAAVTALLFGWVLMLLWNWLMPQLFGLSVITYWQGWGLILLSHLLFKTGGFGGRMRHHHPLLRDGHRHPDFRGRPEKEDVDEFKREFRHRMRQKWHDHNGYDRGHSGHYDDEKGRSDKSEEE